MVRWALLNAEGGELFVPKIPSYKITDVAEAIGPNCIKEIVGVRPGEKIHEEMITRSDSATTVHTGKYYAILPSDGKLLERYINKKENTKKVQEGFSYNSGENEDFLTPEEIRTLIRQNIDKDFQPV